MSEVKYLKGTVKSVLSGDTVVIRGEPRGGPPPEKTFSFANITAPRCGRRPTASNPVEVKDEPCAWMSREFLREKLVGKKVSYFIEYTVPSGREFGHIVIDPNTVREENVTLSVITAGLAKVRDNSKGGGEFLEKLKAAQGEAEANKRGVFADDADVKVRKIKWEVENGRALCDKAKSKPQKAIVEQVRDASTLRMFLLPGFQYVTVSLTGLKAPGFKRGDDGKDKAEPFADEGKFFVESRLLQREISVVLEGISGNNLLGTVYMNEKNLSLFLLKNGYAKVVDWSIGNATADIKQYRAAQVEAQKKKMRIWKSYKPRQSNVSSSDKQYTATVVEIVSTDSLMLDRSGTKSRVFLSSIRQPRKAREEGASRAPRFYEHPYGFEAREFLRKKLIGQQVDVTTDYVQPAANGYPEKAGCSIYIGKINVAEALVSKGYATVVRYKEDDENRSAHYDDLLAAETRAIKNQQGVHNPKDAPLHRIADVTTKAQGDKFAQSMKRKGKVSGVVEYVSSGSRFRVFIPQETCVIPVVLAGVTCPRTGRNGSADEPFSREALEFSKAFCHQHDVLLEVEDADKNGSLICHLHKDGKNLGVELVRNGYATLHFSYERNRHPSEFAGAEESAKAAKLRLYKDWEEKERAKQIALEEKESASVSERKTSKVVVTEVASTNSVYVQDAGNSELKRIMQEVSSYCAGSKVTDYSANVGDLICAQFSLDREWYRAKVLEVEGDTMYTVQYVDFGNKEEVPASAILPLPTSCKAAKPQARLVQLAGLAEVPADWAAEALDVVKDTVLNKAFMCTEVFANEGVAVVTLKGETAAIDVSEDLLGIGYGVVASRMPAFMAAEWEVYKQAQSLALNDRVGIYLYGDVTDDGQSGY